MKLVGFSDGIILALATALVFSFYVFFWAPSGDATSALIAAPGMTRKLELVGEGELDVAGAIGTSTISWDQRGVRFLRSPCQAKHCIHAGWLKRAGQVAACLPNGITIELINGSQRYDAIGF